MTTSRQETCRATADALERFRAGPPELTAFVGFDGFVDQICDVVEERANTTSYAAVPTIARLAEKINRAAGQSSNYEVVVRQTRLGGNAPLMGNALAALGLDVAFVGAAGHPEVHPVFADFARRADVRGITRPAQTDALEFGDGKLMFGKLEPLAEITWETIRGRLGAETFEHLLARSRLIALVNWTMLPHMSRIWARLIGDVFPHLPESRYGRRLVFVDLADPEKRSRDDLRYALRLLAKMQDHADVTLGLNLKEATQVCAALRLSVPADPRAAILEMASDVRMALGLDCCVVHPRTGAAAASTRERAVFDGPFVREPRLSTGAGDHFNAGFMLGRALHLPLAQCLCAGVGTSGHYVRAARAPSAAELIEFVRDLPEPEVSE